MHQPGLKPGIYYTEAARISRLCGAPLPGYLYLRHFAPEVLDLLTLLWYIDSVVQ